jgi:hypothetical protein
MKKTDLDNDLQMRQHCQNLYEKLKQSRRSLLRVDIVKSKANAVNFKAANQWLNSAIEELTFED